MEIILLGYGKMGKTLEKVALKRGHVIAATIDVENIDDLDRASGDVIIEFSHPSAAYENVSRSLLRNIPVVCGTTGWLDKKEEVEKLCKQVDGTFFYSSNYSLGVNIFFRINAALAKIMEHFPAYDVEINEIHHVTKKDAPSGTAITLAETIINYLSRKTGWTESSAQDQSQLAVHSFRIDDVPGTHMVKYACDFDDIEIKHTAHTRDGFALGAVLVAEWIRDKKGVLNMDDFLKF